MASCTPYPQTPSHQENIDCIIQQVGKCASGNAAQLRKALSPDSLL